MSHGTENMTSIRNYKTNGLTELPRVASDLLTALEHKIILFRGELGAGKTTLIKELLTQLGVTDDTSSPSYAIINNYKCRDSVIYHMDLYRLNDAQEAFDLGLEEMLYSGNHCFIEWPELIIPYLSESYHLIDIVMIGHEERKVQVYSS